MLGLACAWAYTDTASLQSPLVDVDPDGPFSQFRQTEVQNSLVPSAWQPERSGLLGLDDRPSVARLSEEQAGPYALITYVHPSMDFEFAARFSSHSTAANTGFRTVAAAGNGNNPEIAKAKKILQEIAKAKKVVQNGSAIQKEEIDLGGPGRTGISRCGFTWDDAAAKMGRTCVKAGWGQACDTPPKTRFNPKSYWYGQKYKCFTDLPNLNDMTGNGTERQCRTVSVAAGDDWCQQMCNSEGTYCDPQTCECDGVAWATEEVFDMAAPIQEHVPKLEADELPEMSEELHVAVVKVAKVGQLGGLPDCTWRPPKGCSNSSQYECIMGANKGTCSAHNWFDRSSRECELSCVHTSLLSPAPYYAMWYPGPLAKDFMPGEKQPRYQHALNRFSLRTRGVDLRYSDVMLSAICKSTDNKFVGISMYSPAYKAKAERLLRSCSRVGVCCKARLLPPDAFGSAAPEGSDAFRFETLASKPSFILGELEATELPVVFLDTDLEYHSFPHLFVPGSWPNDGRDGLPAPPPLPPFSRPLLPTHRHHPHTHTHTNTARARAHGLTMSSALLRVQWPSSTSGATRPIERTRPRPTRGAASSSLTTRGAPRTSSRPGRRPWLGKATTRRPTTRCSTSCSRRAAGCGASPPGGFRPRTCAPCPRTTAASVRSSSTTTTATRPASTVATRRSSRSCRR